MHDRLAYYRPADTTGVDCDAMRTVEDHADHLGQLMESQLELRPERVGCAHKEAQYEWDQIRQWLAMVSGLRHVDVTPEQRNYWGLCERAEMYDDAKNDVVSDVATEETRLLYAWGATERLMRVLAMPAVPDKAANGKPYNRASQLITTAFPEGEGLEHYDHVLRHLRHHAADDSGLSGDRALTDAAKERPWRNVNAVLLPLGAATRNIHAHGASSYPEPENWHEDARSRNPSLHPAAHAPRLACRGLLLSIQQLLSVTTTTGQHSDFEAEEFGWPVREGGDWQWIEEPSARQLLIGTHLQPPEWPPE